MTDLEINKALALAIGWPERFVFIESEYNCGPLRCRVYDANIDRRTFDYRDWNVIGPIAERYRCFPLGVGSQWASRTGTHVCMYADTPQKAIALAVIKGAKS